MPLGRRGGDQTSAGVGFDSSKQCLIKITGSKTLSGDTFWDHPGDIEVLQDPADYIGATDTNTGFSLNKTHDHYFGGMPEYTFKLSTITGGWSSDDSHFNYNIEARALAVGASRFIINQTNVDPLGGSPKHTTEKLGPQDSTVTNDGVQDWEFTGPLIRGDIGDFKIYATDRNPGETATSTPDMPILLFANGGGTSPMTVTANVILEITRSDFGS